jgi:hypothetical protein
LFAVETAATSLQPLRARSREYASARCYLFYRAAGDAIVSLLDARRAIITRGAKYAMAAARCFVAPMTDSEGTDWFFVGWFYDALN